MIGLLGIMLRVQKLLGIFSHPYRGMTHKTMLFNARAWIMRCDMHRVLPVKSG